MNKHLVALLGAYGIWGFLLPVYLKIFSQEDSLYVLSSRAVWSLVLCIVLLAVTNKWQQIVALFADKRRFWLTCLAGVIIVLNWYVYIWAISNDKVLDASLGYYINPLIVVPVGAVLFQEKISKMQIVAICVAALGVLSISLGVGQFPWVAVLLAISFTAYGTLKKILHVSTIASLTVETAFVFPFALLGMLYMDASGVGAIAAHGMGYVPLLMVLGVLTALPLLLYAYSIDGLPYSLIGVLQFSTPTALMVLGVLYGEPFRAMHAISFGFIWVGVGIYIYSSLQEGRNGRKKIQSIGN